jgi:CBS domain containing-hemolysin-like protein
MMPILTAVVLLLVTVSCLIMLKSYAYVPSHEIKRRAENQDALASRLYRATAYGTSLQLLLSVFVIITAGTGIVLLVRTMSAVMGIAAVIVLMTVFFVAQTSQLFVSYGTRMTAMLTPAVAWIMNYCYPFLNRMATLGSKHPGMPLHTGVFERSDLLQIIERQKLQPDNRISVADLAITQHALIFDDHTASDVLITSDSLKTVLSNDVIGPILINELHESRQAFVLVRDLRDGPIVGTLAFKDLSIKAAGHVRDFMNEKLHYVHEDDSLSRTLHVFFVTYDPWLIVINNAEEFVGAIRMQDVLSTLLGPLASDVAEQYADPKIVAARYATEPTTELETNNEAVYNSEEVIE